MCAAVLHSCKFFWQCTGAQGDTPSCGSNAAGPIPYAILTPYAIDIVLSESGLAVRRRGGGTSSSVVLTARGTCVGRPASLVGRTGVRDALDPDPETMAGRWCAGAAAAAGVRRASACVRDADARAGAGDVGLAWDGVGGLRPHAPSTRSRGLGFLSGAEAEKLAVYQVR